MISRNKTTCSSDIFVIYRLIRNFWLRKLAQFLYNHLPSDCFAGSFYIVLTLHQGFSYVSAVDRLKNPWYSDGVLSIFCESMYPCYHLLTTKVYAPLCVCLYLVIDIFLIASIVFPHHSNSKSFFGLYIFISACVLDVNDHLLILVAERFAVSNSSWSD